MLSLIVIVLALLSLSAVHTTQQHSLRGYTSHTVTNAELFVPSTAVHAADTARGQDSK